MKIIQCEQRTPEWHNARKAIPTASEFSKLITGAGKRSKQREVYSYRKAAELVTGIVIQETWSTEAIEEGIRREAEARSVYQMLTQSSVEEVGFCIHDSGLAGCSPDGLVGENGGVEFKNPQPKTHIGYLLKGKLPSEHKAQVMGSLLVTDREWWDFMSYCPGLPTLIIRVERDPVYEKMMLDAWQEFHDEVQEIADVIEGIGSVAAISAPSMEALQEGQISFNPARGG